MGFYSSDHIPENRGFDTFSGSYLPYGDYRTHYAKDQVSQAKNEESMQVLYLIFK